MHKKHSQKRHPFLVFLLFIRVFKTAACYKIRYRGLNLHITQLSSAQSWTKPLLKFQGRNPGQVGGRFSKNGTSSTRKLNIELGEQGLIYATCMTPHGIYHKRYANFVYPRILSQAGMAKIVAGRSSFVVSTA